MYNTVSKRLEIIENKSHLKYEKKEQINNNMVSSAESGYFDNCSDSLIDDSQLGNNLNMVNNEIKLKQNEDIQQNLIVKVIQFMEAVEKLQMELKQTLEYLNNKNDEVSELKKALMMSQVSLLQLEDKLINIERSSNNGNFIWKITNFKEKQAEAKNNKYKSIYSPCFHSHQNGYKLCSRVFLNGDDSSFGRSLSVFIVVCKGEYDQLLKWPFKQKITFMLIDQINSEFREHIVQSIRPDQNSESFKRPINNMNTASGIPTFCSLSKLDSQEHGYIKDDCAFIKITVETHDLNDLM